jgi:hypothetical protein
MTEAQVDPSLHRAGTSETLRRITSTCISRDIEVWRAVQCRVLDRIDAKEYLLICPAREIGQFRARSARAWTICAEEDFCTEYDRQQIDSLARGETIARRGWLLQQFLKINACADPALADDDAVLIWDADTIPLRRIRFSAEDGKLLYYYSPEYHAPYFETIGKLLGSGNSNRPSFIAQCFPTRVRWARGLVQALRDPASGSYVETVMRSLEGQNPSEFAEYETMGAWNLMHHADEMGHAAGVWCRGGAKWIGKRPSGIYVSLMLRLLAARYDYIAVENWQQTHLSNALSALARAARSPRVVRSILKAPS